MAISITGDAGMELFKLLALRSALSLEIKTGMRMSRNATAYGVAKKQYGLKGNKEKVLAQLNELIAKAEPEGRKGIESY